MARRQRIRSKSGYYHIMIRGNEKKNIFNDEQDKQRFLEILQMKKEDKKFFLHAFCLMDNHVHLMISEGLEDIDKIMKRINVSYVHYFNKKYKRVGHLFQDRYKSEIVEKDAYVLMLARYIHQNPVKAGMVKNIGDYKWSSYNGYLDNKGLLNNLLNKETVLGLFSENEKIAIKEFKNFMNKEEQSEFIDLEEKDEVMDEEVAKKLYKDMINKQGDKKIQSEKLIKEFKTKTNLSIRKIASITGLNKDKINRMLRL